MSRGGAILLTCVACGLLIIGCDAPGDPVTAEVTPASGMPSAPGEVVLMKFGAHWCGPCRRLDRELDQIEGALSSAGVRVQRFNVDRDRSLAQRYSVSSIPHLVLLHDGEVVDEEVGFQSGDQLYAWIRSHGLPSTAARNAAPVGEVRSNPFTE